MKQAVFVETITQESRGIIVTAINGSSGGPPLVKFMLPVQEVKDCHIGKKYILTVEEAD